MKKYIIPAFMGFALYYALISLCGMVGSRLLSSGPLDWLFDLLILPSMLTWDLLTKVCDPSPGLDIYIMILSPMTYTVSFGILFYLAFRLRKKTPNHTK